MKKILFTANLDSFFTKFLIPQLEYFKKNGYEVHVASKSENIDIPFCDKKYDVCFARSFDMKDNIKSYRMMKKILKEEKYDIISCHTPFGGAITRLAAKEARKNGTKVLYMAHGFHFYKGAPLKNWLIFYNVEKYLSKYTDVLVTINSEDYEIAKKKFNVNIELIPGVGLKKEKFDFEITEKQKRNLRHSLGLSMNDFVMIYSAELNKNKNQEFLIKCMKDIVENHNNVHLLLAGKDSYNGYHKKLVEKLNLSENIHFLGFRNDIPELLKISDLAVSTSLREGLPLNVMEALYVGLPVVATECRGNNDLISDDKNGYVVGINDKQDFIDKVKLYYNGYDKEKLKNFNNEIVKKYLLDEVMNKFELICQNNKLVTENELLEDKVVAVKN